MSSISPPTDALNPTLCSLRVRHNLFLLLSLYKATPYRVIPHSSRRIKMALVGGISEVGDGKQNSLEIDGLARFAVAEHNKKQNTLLEFGKVVNAKQQVVAGTKYYITLEATDGGKKKIYEATVWEKPWLNFKELQEFKLIGDAPSGSSA